MCSLLSLQELEALFDSLMHTGHMPILRLPYLVQWLPPRFKLRTPKELAHMYAADLAALRRQDQGSANSGDEIAESDPSFLLSFEDFMKVTSSLQRAQLVTFWYLNHPGHSAFKLWRQRVLERLHRKWAGMPDFARPKQIEPGVTGQ